MENQEKDFVYLTRVLKEPYCEFLEIYLNGGQVEQLGKPSSAIVPSSFDSKLDSSYPQSAENAKKTAEISSYFFYAPANDDGLNDLRNRTLALLYSPANESGAMKINNGLPCNADELYGGDIRSMLILKAPMDLLEIMGKMGLAELRVGEYGNDNERCLYNEIAIGDDGLREILKADEECQTVAYGEFHNILNNRNIFSDANNNKFDEEQLFDSSYEPVVNINIFDKIAKMNALKESESKSIRKQEMDDATAWLEEMKKSGMSPEELALLESAYLDAQNFYGTSPENDGADDDDLPSA